MKKQYVAPAIEVIEVENEGVMAASGRSSGAGLPGFGYENMRSGRGKGQQSITSLNDLEDMINNILTY